MTDYKESSAPRSPSEWFDLGVSLRRTANFGEAMNAFMTAAETAAYEMEKSSADGVPASGNDNMKALEDLRSRALASIDLLREINGFVNTDLMNP